jgi:hypothetical protein
VRHVRALKNHRFRGKLVEIRRVNLEASVTSKRIRALLIRQKKNQIWLSLCSHEFSGLALNQRWPSAAIIL